MPDMTQMPPEMAEAMARMQANSRFLFAHLLPTAIGHVPDIAALRAASPRIVVGAGDASGGQMPHLAALALADRLGIVPASFPGDHQGFATHPGRSPTRSTRPSAGADGADRLTPRRNEETMSVPGPASHLPS